VTHYDHCVAKALSSSLTDDCLLASTWDYAGNTRHATPRLRTPTPRFQHLWLKRRSTARGTSPRRHCLNTLRHACRTTSTVRFMPFTPLCVPSSSPSPSTRPRVPVATYASPHALTPTQQSPREWCGNLAQLEGLVTLTSQSPVTSSPRKKLRASRTIEIIACSWESVVFREQLRVQCVKTTNNLLMWGRYPHSDTSPHTGFKLIAPNHILTAHHTTCVNVELLSLKK
jgi:hypothetical protein